MTAGSEPHPIDVTRIVLRPIANPLPLGFLALTGGTTVLAALQLGWIPPVEAPAVSLVLLAFVAPLQLVAAVTGFLTRDVVASTGMGVLTGTWLAVALVQLQLAPGGRSDALASLLVVAGVAMLVPATGALFGKIVPAAVLVTTALRFMSTGVYEAAGSAAWKTTSGTIGLVLAVLALYAAFALVIDDVRRSTAVPLLRLGRGSSSMSADLRAQVEGVEHEPGVREQL